MREEPRALIYITGETLWPERTAEISRGFSKAVVIPLPIGC
jgi:hypothetical protein